MAGWLALSRSTDGAAMGAHVISSSVRMMIARICELLVVGVQFRRTVHQERRLAGRLGDKARWNAFSISVSRYSAKIATCCQTSRRPMKQHAKRIWSARLEPPYDSFNTGCRDAATGW